MSMSISGFPLFDPILGMGCFDHQSYSREGSGFLGFVRQFLCDLQV